MAWIAITEEFVKTRITGPELAAMKTAALAAGQVDPLPEIISKTVNEWRGKLRRYHTLGAGATVPDELEIHVLAMIRYRLITRLPGLKSLLDENRKDEWEKANYALNHLNEYTFESPTTEDDSTSQSSRPRITAPNRDFKREDQDGI